jgi:hypothetical protein
MHINEFGDTTTIDFRGMAVTIAPSSFLWGDMEVIARLQEGTPESWSQMRSVLARVIVSWDLEDDAGLIPTTAEGMLRIPVQIVAPLFEAVNEAAGPSSEEGNASSPSSGATAPVEESLGPGSETFPNGSETSPLPIASESPSPT